MKRLPDRIEEEVMKKTEEWQQTHTKLRRRTVVAIAALMIAIVLSTLVRYGVITPISVLLGW